MQFIDYYVAHPHSAYPYAEVRYAYRSVFGLWATECESHWMIPGTYTGD